MSAKEMITILATLFVAMVVLRPDLGNSARIPGNIHENKEQSAVTANTFQATPDSFGRGEGLRDSPLPGFRMGEQGSWRNSRQRPTDPFEAE